MRLVLVRHGQTPSNVSGALDTGRPGMNLNARGRQQAADLAARWEQIAPAPHAIAVSPLARTRQTSRPLEERFGLTPLVRTGLREVRGGNVEMSASLADIAQYMLSVLPWLQGQWDKRLPGGENGYELRARFLPAVLEVLQKAYDEAGSEGVAVIVAHGAINRVIASSLSPQIGANLVMMHRLDNGKTCVLESPKDFKPTAIEDLLTTFTAVTWNDVPMSEWDIPSELHASLSYPDTKDRSAQK